jgi:hypothetical protein
MPYDKNDPKSREHHRVYMREWYKKNKKKHLALVAKVNKRRAEENNQLIRDFKSGGCSRCPENEPCTLSAHHINRDDKDFQLGAANQHRKSPTMVAAELAKCICLCENCHRKVHAGILKL